MKKTFSFLLLAFLAINLLSQIPSGYYNGTENLSGTALKSALHNIIDNHNSVSYSSLWSHFQNTDKKSNNKVWDIYSDVPGGTPPYEFTFGSDQCGSYSQEGDCYNREHSWPQSWFNSASPMKTDMFHVYPTDGYVNGQRGSYPYGTVAGNKWTSQNGSKKGDCSYPGYNGTVFEPIDEYKGDVARSYFYMSTRYYGEDNGWQSNGMVNGAEILPWAQNLLMEWSVNDPVSTKEINRNNAIYNIQNNRNPFIDHPEFAILIFSSNYPQPTFSSSPVVNATESVLYEYTITASDSYGNTLNFSALNIPAWLTLTDLGNNTALLSGTPDNSDTGNIQISISATNNYSLPVEQSFTLNVSPVTHINSVNSSLTDIILYPNPANNVLYVKNLEGYYHITIFNVANNKLNDYYFTGNNSVKEIDLSTFPAGVYFVQFIDDKQFTYISKLLKY